MKHTGGELIGIVYRYYPRGISSEDTAYKETEEYLLLSAARRKAGAACETWRALLRQLNDQFPERGVHNDSCHLPTGQYDAGYSGAISLPTDPSAGEHSHSVCFQISFLVPYYLVYSERIVDDLTAPPRVLRTDIICAYYGDTMYSMPVEFEDFVKPEVINRRPLAQPTRHEINYEPSPEEQPYFASIAREIEASFRVERMPPEVGLVVVPDVATNSRSLGEATLYDCLLSDNR